MDESWEWPGSRWWRVDLHAHSPVSYDFKGEADPENPDWTNWITAARDAGIQAIAVTDHNTAAAVTSLQGALLAVENAPVLFPAVELTAGDGSHLLLLVDPALKQAHVEDLLSRLNVPASHRGKQTSRSPLSVENILDQCGEDILVIGAHVNGPDGLLEHDGLQRIHELKNPRLVAADVDPNLPLDKSWLDGSRPEIKHRIAQVWTSDGHRHTELGRRFTWVKMTKPDLEGLRLAFLDGSQSLEPVLKSNQTDPNTFADLAIESITVQNGMFIGRPSAVTVKFNPWMNAIIGGRGTGKSTLVDFCRKTLRRESELDSSVDGEEGSLRSQFDRRMRVPPDRGDTGLLTDDTRINVVYRKDGERFILSWSQDGQVDPIARVVGDELVPEEGEIRERFPLRVYSQKQLFALAQDPNALLSVIDDSDAVRRVEVDRSLGQLSASYLSLRAAARLASNQTNDLPARRAALVDIERKLDVLQTGGQTKAFNEYRINRQLDNAWQAALDGAGQAVGIIGRNAEDLSVSDITPASETDGNQPPEELGNAHESLKRTIEDLKQGVIESVERTQQAIEEIKSGPDASRWQEILNTSESAFREATSQLEEQGISSPNEYDALLGQAETLRITIASLEQESAKAADLDRQAVDVLAEYRELRSKLSQSRIRFAGETSTETVHVEVNAHADRDNLSSELTGILATDRFEDDRQAIALRVLPQQNQPWEWTRFDGVIADLRRFLSGELASWPTHDHRFDAALRRVPPESIDRLALYLPEDTVTVSFQDSRGGGWRSLAQGSPGQQTASLLAFVLGFGSEPIILDQPEDDLDNTLIYDLLVTRLREAKRKRQVIVVSHNPNIVVHGDAELVLSLEAAGGQSRIVCQGGLQERRVCDEICRVMEGGREAFTSRYQRIMSLDSIGH